MHTCIHIHVHVMGVMLCYVMLCYLRKFIALAVTTASQEKCVNLLGIRNCGLV